jgi:Flp pilus assembly protein TadD
MRYLLIPLLVLFSPLSWSEVDVADKNCPSKYGAKLVSLQGKLLFDATRNGQWQAAQLNQTLCEGSRVLVEANSRASIMLSNGIVLRLDAGTVLSLDGISPNDTTFLNLLKGFVHFISRTPKLLKISSPIANAGPEGTEFAMRVDENNASLWVYEGGVKFFNAQGSVHLSPGQGAQAHKGQAPQTKIDIKPQDAVNWALYYPPLLPYPDAKTVIDNELRTAIRDFRQGRVDVALAKLDGLSPEQQTAYFYKVRGAIRLTVGQDKLALQDIHALQANKPNDAEALALQSVLALTQNRKDEAYALASHAIAANPQSASAYSALSYAEQGRFQLDKAQAAADQAVKLASHDAMVWARKAELELSQGLTSESQQAAQKASELDATLERTQTVMGFSYLLRMDTDEALQSFEKAVKLDSTSPLARLGLGLAKIRNGDLEEGRQDLEIAAILDPNNSLIRSYLGKAYYEERRSSLAEDQFGLAKERDPKDPTPYFYNAIEKQTTNRPVEALQDMQKAIELNGNRGVYRSKLMLDKDEAARSAAQGQIYNTLGFSRPGLIEGWKSVSQDPSNFSAHRLLADNYSSQPLHELARVSELLQSQLLQPINTTAVQPQLAETNLIGLQSVGPSSLSFNEFNPIFRRDNFSLQTSGIVGSNDTYGDEIVHSGLWKNLSYSIGQFHSQTNGFRKNNDVNADLITGFIQANLLPNLSIQAEIRHKELDRGDYDLRPDGNFFDDLRIKTNRNTYRAGLHYSLDKGSDIIASYIHLDGSNYSELPLLEDFGTKESIQGNQGEIQYLFSKENFNVVSGLGVAHSGFTSFIREKAGDSSFNKDGTTNYYHNNGYVYTYTHFPKNLDWTLGLSVDSLESTGNPTIIQVNPKVGFIWKATKDTTFRLASFRTLKRTLLSNQTIEPTQVAGFNQFFDDFTRTNTWLYGIGIDQKFGNKFYGGLEFFARDLFKPVDGNKRQFNERHYNAYLNWNITSKLVGTFSFNLEEFYGDKNFSRTLVPLSTITYDGKAGLKYFEPSGFFCSFEAEYVNQRAEWRELYGASSPVKHNDFILFNAGLGYRLPKRYGIIQLDIKNLFDRKFEYQSLGPRTTQAGDSGQLPPFIPDRTILARFTLAF